MTVENVHPSKIKKLYIKKFVWFLPEKEEVQIGQWTQFKKTKKMQRFQEKFTTLSLIKIYLFFYIYFG